MAKKQGGRSVSSTGTEKRRLIERFEERLVRNSRFQERNDENHERRLKLKCPALTEDDCLRSAERKLRVGV